MILQAIVIPVVIFLIWIDPIQHVWIGWVRDGLVYLTVGVTILSGLPYITRAWAASRELTRA